MKKKTVKSPWDHPQFLNVDVEIFSSRKLDLLAAELEKKMVVMYCGRAGNRFQLNLESNYHGKMERTVRELCNVLEKLSPQGKRIWNQASARVFDFGYEFDPADGCFHTQHVDADLLKRISALNAKVVFTCYSFAKTGSTPAVSAA